MCHRIIASLILVAVSIICIRSLEAQVTADRQAATEPQFSFVETNGVKLRLATMGEGPVVVLLHGFPGSWYTWRHQLPALSKAGYRVVAPDLRGYGESDRPHEVQDYAIDVLSADVVGILDALGEQDAILVGHDWGGLIGWAAMLQYPDRFRAYVAMSAPYGGRMKEPFIKTLENAHGDNFYYILYFQEVGIAESELDKDPRGFLSRVYVSPDTPLEKPILTDPKMSAGGLIPRIGVPKERPDWLTEDDLSYLVKQFTKSGFRGPINYYRNFDRFFEVSQQLKEEKVAKPVFFLSGEKDPNIGGANQEQLSALLSGGTQDLRGVKLIPNAGHWVQQEAIEETNTAIIEFINELK